ncbi:MAG: hypothetical protein HYZ42_03775 [Bacteroidetes bacterium]|nr:hypothetical protein [Bacteroidota bacterium]
MSKTQHGKGAQGVTAQTNNNGTSAEHNNKLLTDKPGLEPKADETKVEPKPELSVEDKIRKVEMLTEAIEKRTLLKNHLVRVDSLKLGDFEEKETLTINGQGGSYIIKSNSLIKEIAALVKVRIEEQIAIVEEQIKF